MLGALRGGQSVGLPVLGWPSVKVTAVRIGVRPGTREKMQNPADKNVGVKASAVMRVCGRNSGALCIYARVARGVRLDGGALTMPMPAFWSGPCPEGVAFSAA